MVRPQPGLVVGVGCRRGTPVQELADHLREVLARRGGTPADVAVLATADAKAGEPGLVALAARLGVRLTTFPADVLAAQEVPGSRVVAAAVGTPSVAEAAVLASGATLVTAKHARAGSTLALGAPAAPGS